MRYKKHQTFWQTWQADNPERQALIVEAKAFLAQLTFQKVSADAVTIDAELTNMWTTIEKQTKGSNSSDVPNALAKFKQISIWDKRWRIAASILFLLAASWLTWQYSSNEVIYATNYGETETVILPDGSQVILQANSTLKIPKDWEEKSAREVSLVGQAFFDVTKLETTTPIKFIVQTSDFNVEVLGTQFDVLNRPKNKRVVLQEGKVRMKVGENRSIDLQPNEMVYYSSQLKNYQKSAIEAANFTAWTNHQLVLKQTALSEIARILTDNYGFQVRFAADVDASITRNSVGSIPINDVDDLIAVTAASYEVMISKEGKLIKIEGQ